MRSEFDEEFDEEFDDDDEEFGAISSSECSVSLLRRKATRSGWMGCTRIKRRQTLSWLTAGSELSEGTNNKEERYALPSRRALESGQRIV